MILVAHIIIALSSLLATGVVFLKPSKQGLRFSYFLVALTLATGTYLVFLKPAHLTQTCMEGLIYLGFVTLGIASARNKLAKTLEN
jgi:hypothetical protein